MDKDRESPESAFESLYLHVSGCREEGCKTCERQRQQKAVVLSALRENEALWRFVRGAHSHFDGTAGVQRSLPAFLRTMKFDDLAAIVEKKELVKS